MKSPTNFSLVPLGIPVGRIDEVAAGFGKASKIFLLSSWKAPSPIFTKRHCPQGEF